MRYKLKNLIAINIIFLTLFLFACTDGDKTNQNPKKPWVIELHAIPTKVTLNPDKFYAKPFTIRAKYSNATAKNITSQIQWVSEKENLLSVNKKGELITNGKCNKTTCSVYLIGTDPSSGKSVRVTVILKPEKNVKISSAKKKALHSQNHLNKLKKVG